MVTCFSKSSNLLNKNQKQFLSHPEISIFPDSKGTVTCLRMMRFPVLDDKNVDDIIAVGLHEGSVYFYAISEHDVGLRMTFKAEQIKKLSIPHKQPVVNLDITNEEGYVS